MRPSGVMPDWAADGSRTEPADLGPGVTPHTRDLREINWDINTLANFKRYRDSLEFLTWTVPTTIDDPLTMGAELVIPQTCTRSMIWDPNRRRLIVTGRDDSDPASTMNSWSLQGNYWATNNNAPQPSAPPAKADLQIVTTAYGTGDTTAHYFGWVNLRDSSNVILTSEAWFYFNDSTVNTFGNDWSASGDTPVDLVRIGGATYDDDEGRIFVFGHDGAINLVIYSLLLASGHSWEVQTIDQSAGVLAPPTLGACSAQGRIVSSGAFLWRANNRFATWKIHAVSDLLPGETELLGLWWSPTDLVFVGVTETAVWTSPNGILWSKTPAPAPIAFTGAGTSLGGTTVVLAKVSATGWALLIGTNGHRDWRAIPSPIERGGSNPISQIYAVDGRLAALSNDDPTKISFSQRLL